MTLMNAKEFHGKFALRPPRFVSHLIKSGGLLPDEPGAHACWYYCRIAIQSMKAVDDGAQYDGELDHIKMTNNIARSVALLYRLDSPDDFLKFMMYVRIEAARLELEWDQRIETPFNDTYVKHSW